MWSRNNRACATTWTTLRVLEQNQKPFADSGGIPMKALAFWSSADSAEMRALKAATLARQMDNVFRLIRGARYEEGVTVDEAVSGIGAVLTDGQKTISDLSSVSDACYRFWGEEDEV